MTHYVSYHTTKALGKEGNNFLRQTKIEMLQHTGCITCHKFVENQSDKDTLHNKMVGIVYTWIISDGKSSQ